MSKLKHFEIPEGVYFVTTNTVNNELYFEIDDFAEIVCDCLLFQRIKSKPPRRVGIPADQSTIGNYPKLRSVWQKNYYDHVIRNEKDFDEKWQYIYNNPVDSGLVDRPQKYKWSSFYKHAPEIDEI